VLVRVERAGRIGLLQRMHVEAKQAKGEQKKAKKAAH
jgi:hypothetical protein